MEYSVLGSSDLTVSRLAFGCEPLGGTEWGAVDPRAAMDAVRRADDLGVTLFDTAAAYGLGRSEELLAEALGSRRHDVVIASKGGISWESRTGGERARTRRDSSQRQIVLDVEATLRRLRLDCVPLYYLHWPDPDTPIAETMDALQECRNAGKIRHVGLSNFSPVQVEQAHACAPITAVQLEYSLLKRDAYTQMLPTCATLGISLVAYGPLGQGMLTGKYGASATFDERDRRARLPHFREGGIEAALRQVRDVQTVAATAGRSAAQTALRWVLESPGIACAIAGAKTPAQVEENAGACHWRLTPAVLPG